MMRKSDGGYRMSSGWAVRNVVIASTVEKRCSCVGCGVSPASSAAWMMKSYEERGKVELKNVSKNRF